MSVRNEDTLAAPLPMQDGVDSIAIEANNALQSESPTHILVINDTQEILDLFRDILEDEGHRVSLYLYAFQDIAEVREIRPDLVILDFVIGGEAHGEPQEMTQELMAAVARLMRRG